MKDRLKDIDRHLQDIKKFEGKKPKVGDGMKTLLVDQARILETEITQEEWWSLYWPTDTRNLGS